MARKPNGIGGFAQLWARHESLYYDIFTQALKGLSISDDQRANEDEISAALCPLLKQACFSHKDKPSVPKWELPISPVTQSQVRNAKSAKRPDFTCSLVDPFAQSAEKHELSLHVECKRLGDSSGSWKLNRNYSTNGVNRFDCAQHCYGKNACSGFMIGYIISSEPRVIIVEVNNHLPASIAPLSFPFREEVESTSSRFNRANVEPKDFKLIHIWVDLR